MDNVAASYPYGAKGRGIKSQSISFYFYYQRSLMIITSTWDWGFSNEREDNDWSIEGKKSCDQIKIFAYLNTES